MHFMLTTVSSMVKERLQKHDRDEIPIHGER